MIIFFFNIYLYITKLKTKEKNHPKYFTLISKKKCFNTSTRLDISYESVKQQPDFSVRRIRDFGLFTCIGCWLWNL